MMNPATLRGAVTPRQREYLATMAKGYDGRDLASRLHVSTDTVRQTKYILYHKMKVKEFERPGQRAVAIYAMAYPDDVPDETLVVRGWLERDTIKFLAKGMSYAQLAPEVDRSVSYLKELMCDVWKPMRQRGFTAPLYRAITLSVAKRIETR